MLNAVINHIEDKVETMAKYTRFDPRNKKRNKHKDQYLDRFVSNKNKSGKKSLDEDEDCSLDVKHLYKKYHSM